MKRGGQYWLANQSIDVWFFYATTRTLGPVNQGGHQAREPGAKKSRRPPLSLEVSGTYIRLVLAHSDPVSRDAIEKSLAQQADFEIVARVSDGKQALAEVERHAPDVLLIEPDLPNGTGIAVTKNLCQKDMDCGVLMLGDDYATDSMVQAIEAGASGYVTRDESPDALIDSIRAIAKGDIAIPPRLLHGVLAEMVAHRRRRDGVEEALDEMTPREKQVMELAVTGASNDDIAESLIISPETVRTHLQRGLTKLGVHSRSEALALLSETGVALRRAV